MRRLLLVVLAIVLLAALGTYVAARHVLGSDLVRVQLEQQLSARLKEPVRIASATATIFPDIAVDLGEVSVGQPEALHLGRVRVLTGWRTLFSHVVDVREVKVWNGRPGGDPHQFTFDLDASVLGDRLDVKALTVRGPTIRIDAKGTLTSIANVEGSFDAASDFLDLTELVAIGAALAPPDRKGAARHAPMHLAVRVATPRLKFATYEFRDLSTAIDAVPSRIVFDALSLRLFGGTFKGRLDADTRPAAPVLRLTGALASLDVADLLARTGTAGGLTGRLDGKVALVSSGSDGATLMHAARGTIGATIANGTMPHLDLVRTVVLAFGKPSGGAGQGSGTSFESLGGTFALAAGTLRSENLTLRSRDFDVGGRGTLALESGAVDARGDVVLSPELTAQAGTDLRRYAQQDGRVIVPATVGGTLRQPSVFVDVAAAAKRALGNELRRRATDFLGGLFKKKKGSRQ